MTQSNGLLDTREAQRVGRNGRVPILMYHQLARRPDSGFRGYSLTPKAFERQMRWLATAGYRTITLDDLLAHRNGRGPVPSKPVIITFDDGFLGPVEWAVPLLRSLGFTATFFVVAGLVGESSRWLQAEMGVDFPLMGWAALRRLRDDGFQVGSHTMSHPRLAELEEAECRAELVESKRLIEDRLDVEVRHLAYPYGSFDADVVQMAADAGYASACTVRAGLSEAGEANHMLSRVWVPARPRETTPEFVLRMFTGVPVGKRLGEGTRRTWRRLRRRLGYVS